LEGDKQSSVIRGTLADEKNNTDVLRRSNRHPITFKPQDCQWLCIDIDDLPLPSKFDPLTDHLEDIAIYTASHLPKEFEGIDFYFQFSSSMGIKSGIRIHLWYWLAKTWLSDAKTKIDFSLYQAVQVHYTAAPIFEIPEQNPLQQRSSIVQFGNEFIEVPVPEGLNELVVVENRKRRTRTRTVNSLGQIEHHRIVRDENDKVVNGREQFLFDKSVEAVRILTENDSKPHEFNNLEELAALTWKLFCNEADNSDEKWTLEDAKEKAQARIGNLKNDWSPHGISPLIPDIEPYFEYEALDKNSGTERIETALDGFFSHVLSCLTQKKSKSSHLE
jgi:hypothetical protein